MYNKLRDLAGGLVSLPKGLIYSRICFASFCIECQAKNSKSMKKGQVKFCKVAPSVASESPKFQTGSKTNILQETVKTKPRSDEVTCSIVLEETVPLQLSTIGKQHIDDHQLENQSSSQPQSPPKKGLLSTSISHLHAW